jgi:hypothetical protein
MYNVTLIPPGEIKDDYDEYEVKLRKSLVHFTKIPFPLKNTLRNHLNTIQAVKK